MIRAGTVNATLQIAMVLICSLVKFKSAPTVVAKGGKLNQTTNDKKNANQVMCSILYRPPELPHFSEHLITFLCQKLPYLKLKLRD